MAQPLPVSSFERLSATDDWEDFKREALLIAKTQPELWDAIADLADDMFDGGREAVADIRQIAPKEDYKTLLAGVVSKLHQLPPNKLDQLIKEGEADPEINVEEEELGKADVAAERLELAKEKYQAVVGELNELKDKIAKLDTKIAKLKKGAITSDQFDELKFSSTKIKNSLTNLSTSTGSLGEVLSHPVDFKGGSTSGSG